MGSTWGSEEHDNFKEKFNLMGIVDGNCQVGIFEKIVQWKYNKCI
jgi:hypothetical protein